MPITPNDIRLVIMTISREPEYIHKTIASLFISDPLVHKLKGIHLVVGSADAAYLNHYGHHKILQIHSMEKKEAEQINEWIVHQKFCFNYHRCLTIPEVDYAGLCICEDDIVFQDRFVEKMVAAVNEIEEKYSIEKYLLDLYIPYGFFPDNSFKTGELCYRYYPQFFYGTQCIYYPRSIVPEIAKTIYEGGIKDYLHPGDVLIRKYMNKYNVLYGTKRSLVQHIGFNSTGLAGVFHRSPSFNELCISNHERDKKVHELIHYNIRESIGGIFKTLGYVAQRKGVELIFEVLPNVPESVSGDLFGLCDVLYKLVENVLNDTIEGEIIICLDIDSIHEHTAILKFIIADTGRGTQNQWCADLQADDFIITEDNLGLHKLINCINYIFEMRGEIWIQDDDDTRLNKINQFQFTLPFSINEETRNSIPIKPIEELQGRTIVVVDDNLVNRNMLTKMLCTWGIHPIVIDSGKEALNILNEKRSKNIPVWMTLLDAHMPEMDGFEVARRIGLDSGLTQNTLMMLTEEIKGDKAALCREVNIYSHINKPILYSELLEALIYFANNSN